MLSLFNLKKYYLYLQMKSVLFIILTIATSNLYFAESKMLNTKKFLAKDGEKSYNAYISADDKIIDVTVNGESVLCSFEGNLEQNWDKLKSGNIEAKPGDKISITGKNINGAYTAANTAAIIFGLKLDGYTFVTNTEDWTCNGRKPMNDGRSNSYSETPNAQWIWDSEKPIVAVCEATVPSKPAIIYYTVDDKLTDFKINGVSAANSLNQNSEGDRTNWGLVKKMTGQFTTGDELTFDVVDTGGAQGFVATITYDDMNGASRTITSGEGNFWKCGGANAKRDVQYNDPSKWAGRSGFADNIKGEAWWIWAEDGKMQTTCTVTLP